MSSASGVPGKRPGFFDSFRAALTPAELPPDDGKPIVAPRTITIATILAVFGGLLMVFVGGVSVVSLDAAIDDQAAVQQRLNDECVAEFGGIGASIPSPAESAPQDVKDRAALCAQYQELTPELISQVKTQQSIISVVIIVIGLLAVVGGWLLRSGKSWSRFLVIGAVALAVLLSLAFRASNLFTLVGTLAMIISVMLCYIGGGATYFARVKRRRLQA